MASRQSFEDKLSEILKGHNALMDCASDFYNKHEKQIIYLHSVLSKLSSIEKQIVKIQTYQRKHGKLPTIIGQKSTSDYLDNLFVKKQDLTTESEQLIEEQDAIHEFNWKILEKLTDLILDMFEEELEANRFVSHFILAAPDKNDKKRQQKNDRSKPLFHAALGVHFLNQLAINQLIESNYVTSRIPENYGDKKKDIDPAEVDVFKQQVLKPYVRASLVQQIGIFSREADDILGEDKFRDLSVVERKKLLSCIYKKSFEFLKYGISVPTLELSDVEKIEKEGLDLTSQIIVEKCTSKHILGDILRIPMICASYLLSTKSECDEFAIFSLFEKMKQASEKGLVNQQYCDAFLKMIGHYPIGSGIYFVTKESNEIESAIVMYLNPENLDEPICKQVTKARVHKIDARELIIPFKRNLLNKSARDKTGLDELFFKNQYPDGFYWNAAEKWDSQIDPKEFWRDTGKRVKA